MSNKSDERLYVALDECQNQRDYPGTIVVAGFSTNPNDFSRISHNHHDKQPDKALKYFQEEGRSVLVSAIYSDVRGSSHILHLTLPSFLTAYFNIPENKSFPKFNRLEIALDGSPDRHDLMALSLQSFLPEHLGLKDPEILISAHPKVMRDKKRYMECPELLLMVDSIAYWLGKNFFPQQSDPERLFRSLQGFKPISIPSTQIANQRRALYGRLQALQKQL